MVNVKVVFLVITSRGGRGETVNEGEEDSDGTRVKTHSGGQGRRVGIPLLAVPGLRLAWIYMFDVLRTGISPSWDQTSPRLAASQRAWDPPSSFLPLRDPVLADGVNLLLESFEFLFKNVSLMVSMVNLHGEHNIRAAYSRTPSSRMSERDPGWTPDIEVSNLLNDNRT